MRSVNGLPSARLTLAARPAGAGALTATVANTGTSPAAMVRLRLLTAAESDAPALPGLADDNFLWLLPGESCAITLRWPVGVGAVRQPAVVAEAYNALAVTADPVAAG